MKRTIKWRHTLLATISTALAITLVALYFVNHTNQANLERELQQQLRQTEQQERQLKNHDKTLKQLEAEKQRLKKQIKDLQAKKKARTVYAATLPQKPATAPVRAPQPTKTTSGCGDNQYAHYIYMKESGCRTTAVNSIGCRGIGQACPGTKLPCGADYACQNQWFTNYAMQRYGSWYKAYQFWLAHKWW